MNENQFREFIESEIVKLMASFELEEMSVKDGKGNKAKVKKNKDNIFVVEVSRTKLIY